ncbi:MAG TPA: hypothetical protein EYN91_17680 [Candidatus Melainabacteria bacterium]|jgi:hypothetical protein|nr:hypothetical protein [Candidatus Melainabacteria bacterium]HIN66534.1 hypothetical protein [Candidatus Obscuribacterales bacterium]
MKDWHWVLVFASILITPFLPALMKAKCPECKKRKLNSLDTLRDYNATGDERVYNTFHRCDACLTYFKAVNSKPKVVSSHEEYEAAVRETQLRQPVVS